MNDIKIIADHFGIDKQTKKAIEEASEYIKALLKNQEYGTSETYKSLVEEVADAEIMIAQIKYLHGISEEQLNKIKLNKIARQMGRIAAETAEITNLHADVTQIGMIMQR